MRSRTLAVSFLLSMVLGIGPLAARAEPQAGTDKSISAIKDVLTKALAGWMTLDPANAAPYYAKDASLAYFDLAPLKYTGWDAYAAGVKEIFADLTSVKFTLNDDLLIHRSGNTAWATTTMGTEMIMKGGATESTTSRWTAVLERRGKNWLIVHDHVSVPMAVPDSSPQSLYKRLGGYDALAAVTDDFLGRITSDGQLAPFFAGHATNSLKHIRQLVVDQLCAATGGPCIYTGRDMKTSHTGLGISESDWDVAVKHLVATLDKFKVPEKEKSEVLTALSGMKKDIVNLK